MFSLFIYKYWPFYHFLYYFIYSNKTLFKSPINPLPTLYSRLIITSYNIHQLKSVHRGDPPPLLCVTIPSCFSTVIVTPSYCHDVIPAHLFDITWCLL